jgi:hypothetical protein
LPSVARVEIQAREPIEDFRVQSCNEDFGIVGGSDSDLIENILLGYSDFDQIRRF